LDAANSVGEESWCKNLWSGRGRVRRSGGLRWKIKKGRFMSIFLTLLVACSSTVGPQENGSANISGQDALPVDLEMVSNRSFDAITEGDWGIVSRESGFDNMAVVADADVLPSDQRESPPNALVITYPKGFQGGSAPHNRTWFSVSELEWSEVFISFWVKFSENWTGHRSAVNKIVYVPQEGYGSNPIYLIARGTGQESLFLEVRTQDPRFANRNLGPNRSKGELVRGRWHRIDMYARFNDGNQKNGEVRYWLDGQLAGEYYDVQYSVADDSKIWGAVKIDAIWGGTGDVVPEKQTLSFDHFIVRGRK
jgi:hypothetical protein